MNEMAQWRHIVKPVREEQIMANHSEAPMTIVMYKRTCARAADAAAATYGACCNVARCAARAPHLIRDVVVGGGRC